MEATQVSMQRVIEGALERANEHPEDVRPFMSMFLVDEACQIFSADQNPSHADARSKWKHPSYQSLVLEYGTVRIAPVRTDDCLGKMAERNCFGNAFEVAMDYPDYTYCEGFAQTDFMVVPHAWLEDERGEIVDPTWVNNDLPATLRATYAGIKFDTEFVLNSSIRTGWTSILSSDWITEHQILKYGLVLQDDLVIDLGEL